MPVPEEIRRVERPANTIVQDSGKDGPKRYRVRERKGVKYVSGNNPQPINGKTVGYIIDYKFIPLCKETSTLAATALSYGSAALVRSVGKDVCEDLLKVYPPDLAFSIFSLATLKVMRPGISGSRMSSAYESSFVSVFWPGASLSKNSVTSLYKTIGADGNKRAAFFEHRIARVCENDHILIDGTLKQDTSRVNDLSAFSYKARLKGCEDISVLYAFDLEKMEPICAQVFPGNSIDATSYKSFVRDNKLWKGIIVADKGFPPNEIRDILAKEPLLHYITPVKRNDSRIKTHEMLKFEGVLNGISKAIQYRKANVAPGVWLYAFRDPHLAAAEEKTYLEKARKNNTYDDAKYREKKAEFGLIVFESDRDIDATAAYLTYEERWKLELVFKAYKNDDCLDRTSVQGDFSVHGSEFVNFITTLLTCRIITKATKAGLLADMTYGSMIEDLNVAWRRTDAPPEVKPVTDDDYWVHTIPKVFEILERLELSEPVPKPAPKKKGRKPKPKNIQPSTDAGDKELSSGSAEKNKNNTDREEVDKTDLPRKRPVGRPRTKPAPNPNIQKRPVGRPRKSPVTEPTLVKRPVGRPRTKPLPDPSIPKRPVGRPRKKQDDLLLA